MKIACIDNMNNSLFAFCRYMQDEGIDAHLYTMPQVADHFRPEADTYRNIDTLGYVHEFPVDAKGVRFIFSHARELRALREYDLIIASGYSIGFLARHGIRTDVFVSYGSDLFQMPFFRFSWSRPMASFGEWLLACCQRAGIRHSRVIISNIHYKLYAEALRRLGTTCTTTGYLAVYPEPPVPEGDDCWSFMDRHDFTVFSHSRQLWQTQDGELPDFKMHGGNNRNDKLVRAFAAFIRNSRFQAPLLILFEYGPDVEATKALVRQCGIENSVKWMPKMARRAIMHGLKRASMAGAEFRETLCGIGGTSLESLACGVPLMTNTNGAREDRKSYLFQVPLLDVLSEGQIQRAMEDYERDPESGRRLGQRGSAWFNEHLGKGLAAKYAEMVRRLHQDPRLTQTSPEIKSIFENTQGPAA